MKALTILNSPDEIKIRDKAKYKYINNIIEIEVWPTVVTLHIYDNKTLLAKLRYYNDDQVEQRDKTIIYLDDDFLFLYEVQIINQIAGYFIPPIKKYFKNND